jgi:hypothetical protein
MGILGGKNGCAEVRSAIEVEKKGKEAKEGAEGETADGAAGNDSSASKAGNETKKPEAKK